MIVWLLSVSALADDPQPTAVESATRVLQQLRAQYATAQATSEEVYLWSVRVMEAERAEGDPDAPTAHLNRMRDLERTVNELATGGMAPALEIDAARYYVAEAISWAGEEAAAAPEPEAETPSGDIDACFADCDKTYETGSVAANNYRLGVGPMTGSDAACETRAESKCGAGKSASRAACRETEVRECQAAKMLAECAREQTQCQARCR